QKALQTERADSEPCGRRILCRVTEPKILRPIQPRGEPENVQRSDVARVASSVAGQCLPSSLNCGLLQIEVRPSAAPTRCSRHPRRMAAHAECVVTDDADRAPGEGSPRRESDTDTLPPQRAP